MTATPASEFAHLIRQDEAMVAVVPLVRWLSGPEPFSRLLITSSRILDIGANGAMSEISHADIDEASIVRNRLEIRYRSGRAESYGIASAADANVLADVLPKLAGNGTSTDTAGRQPLCPTCIKRIAPGAHECPWCRGQFRTISGAVLRQLFIPGGGYVYAGVWRAASIDVMAQIACVIAVIGAKKFAEVFDLWSAGSIITVAVSFFLIWKVVTVVHAGLLMRDPIPKLAARETIEKIVWVDDPPKPLKIATQAAYGLLVAPAVLWTDENNRESSEAKRTAAQQLERIAPVLRNVVEPDETILFVTSGSAPFSIADFLTPFRVLFLMKRCAYVFTDRRVLQIPLETGGMPRHAAFATRWADMAGYEFLGRYTFGTFVNLSVRCHTVRGDKVQICRLSLEAFRKLMPMFKRVVRSGTGARTEGQHALCLACGGEVPFGIAHCRACRATFRDLRLAPLWALLLPGGGYISCGYSGMGAAILLYELGLLLSVGYGVLLGSMRIAAGPAAFFVLQKLAAVAHARELSRERLLKR